MKWFQNGLAVLFATVAILLATPAMALEGSSTRPGGLGIGVGQTFVSGISLKQNAGGNGLQGVIGCFGYRGWSNSCRGIGISGDFLVHMPVFLDADVVALGWNLGGGASVGVGFDGHYYGGDYYGSGTFHLGGQFVAGFEVLFPTVPLDLVIEWRPMLRVAPGFRIHPFSGGAHIRFYLN